MRIAVYAVDVGSVSQKKLGWARAHGPTGRVDPDAKETEIARLADEVASDLDDGWPVALGFECPLYVPVPQDPYRLGKARKGEGNRAWSAGAGSGALTTGLVQAAWILRAVKQRAKQFSTHLDWNSFASQPTGLFLWEAFVSAKAKAQDQTHHGDAAIAVDRFMELLPNPGTADELDAETPLSLIAAAALWSGCSEEPGVLKQKCLVVKAAAP